MSVNLRCSSILTATRQANWTMACSIASWPETHLSGKLHSTKKVSSHLTFIDITREIFNQNCSFKMSCMQNFLTHILSGYSLSILTTVLRNHGIYDISCKKKKVVLFVNRPIALQCMTLKYWHKNSMPTMERLVAPLNKSATFFPSTLLNKTDILIMKIMIYCTE